VAFDPIDGSAWACERTGDDVRHVNYAGAASGSATTPQPSRVAVDSVTRRIWVTSFTDRSVRVFGSNGFPADTIPGLGGPIGIAIDSRAGRIWVADAGADRVLVYDRSGNELFRVGLLEPLEIALDATSGEAWVVLSTAGQVARIASDGRVLVRAGGLIQPYDIAIERAH
jgi:DNA-binding beta-propeller fold protein YncE